MGKQQKHGMGISDIQSLYINRVRGSKERVQIECIGGLVYNGTVIAFDMYTVLVDAETQDKGQSIYKQVLLYKNNIVSIKPAGRFVPVIVEKLNKE